MTITNWNEVAATTKRIEEAVADSKKRSLRYGANLMRRDQARAAAVKADPQTGAPWARRTRSYPWPLLWKTGELAAHVDASYGFNTKDGKKKLFGKVRDADKLLAIRAGAIHHGRTGEEQSRHVRSRTKARNKLFRAGKISSLHARYKYMPARPLFGLSKASQRRFRDYWLEQIKQAQDG
jgi:hypothetical protein